MPIASAPRFVIVESNRLDELADRVIAHLAADPPDPLDEDVVLVQSNATADWLKMRIAERLGICAAFRFELPGRFVWSMYRAVLGADRVAETSPLDRDALVWRLMHELPRRLEQPLFAPVAAFLADGDPARRLQLARRLADLYDQYQVHRADWLLAWEEATNVVTDFHGNRTRLPAEQRWQSALWRDLLRGLGAAEQASTRPAVHRAFVDALRAGAPTATPLPRRVVLFGASYLPAQTLEALGALGSSMEVILAVSNPSPFHWADMVDGRELLRARARHARRGAVDLATVPLEAMHLHAPPLLAAWGRQGRDFMQLLDRFAETQQGDGAIAIESVDAFDTGEPRSVLEQVQAAIRDLVPLVDTPERAVPDDDRSIAFAVCHGPMREVEVLHDQLLRRFADDERLAPRDVIVMVPDIDTFAPAIRAVFGQHAADDPRRIPFDIADVRSRGSNPLVVALDYVLRLPDQRARASELRDLLDVPAIAARFGIATDALPGLFEWVEEAGVRWGLDADHRDGLGLASCGAQNTWAFGLDRMLLGYATGHGDPFADIEPDDEVGGLEAADVGGLAAFVDRLSAWRALARVDATPDEWTRRATALVDDLAAATDDRERVTLAALETALAAWRDACAAAGYDERVPLAILREGWLGGLEGLEAGRRFLNGNVTFCTLMPLRAVPFDVVCLLGMNDGDFPRRGRRDDFDLMGLPGMARPGDRSRRDDDRYLMLEALLSARRALYVSWSGRSARDNTVQPPSVLVAQLRDYLDEKWKDSAGRGLAAARTVPHPLQPFSRRYFEVRRDPGDERDGFVSFAREWRDAHADAADDAPARAAPPFDATTVRVVDLVRFLRNAPAAFFRARLGIRVDDAAADSADEERFELVQLARYRMLSDLLDDPDALERDLADALERRLSAQARAGALPIGTMGERTSREIDAVVAPMLAAWRDACARYPLARPRIALRHERDGLTVDDWLAARRSDGDDEVHVELSAAKLLDKDTIKPKRLLHPWVSMLVAAACGHASMTLVIGPDATVLFTPLDRDAARVRLDELLDAWREGMSEPLPLAIETAALHDQPSKARNAYDGGFDRDGERKDFCLARTYPDFAALAADGRFDALSARLVAPMVAWGDACRSVTAFAASVKSTGVSASVAA